MTTVKFSDGREKAYDADTASVSGPLFVLYKWNKKTQKEESGQTFLAEEVAYATCPDGRVVIGGGTVQPSRLPES